MRWPSSLTLANLSSCKELRAVCTSAARDLVGKAWIWTAANGVIHLRSCSASHESARRTILIRVRRAQIQDLVQEGDLAATSLRPAAGE